MSQFYEENTILIGLSEITDIFLKNLRRGVHPENDPITEALRKGLSEIRAAHKDESDFTIHIMPVVKRLLATLKKAQISDKNFDRKMVRLNAYIGKYEETYSSLVEVVEPSEPVRKSESVHSARKSNVIRIPSASRSDKSSPHRNMPSSSVKGARFGL